MQLKHPEILYFLVALLIPVFIHLFQLQRFVKVPFTNVAFLKKLELQSRRSSRLKKWLTLFARLLALVALIIAFAQPFSATSDTAKPWETIVVLDNSISMQAESPQGELLKSAIHDLLEYLPEKGAFSLYTQSEAHVDLDKDDFKEALKSVDYVDYATSLVQLMLNVQSRIKQQPSKQFKVIWLTDLQKTKTEQDWVVPKDLPMTVVPLSSTLTDNVSIDTVYVSQRDEQTLTLKVEVQNQGDAIEQLTINAYQNDILLSKAFLSVSKDAKASTALHLTEIPEKLRLSLDVEDVYVFDNQYYIGIEKPETVKALEVSDKETFVSRILNDEPFDYKRISMAGFPYDRYSDYKFIVLNEPSRMSETLVNMLKQYVSQGGSLLYIPATKAKQQDINALFLSVNLGQVIGIKQDSLLVTKIHYDHPLFASVFEKRVSNFQYPVVASYLDLPSFQGLPVLSFEDNRPFLLQKKFGQGQFYSFLSALNKANSNFSNAPLVVPVIYKMAIMSDASQGLSYRLGQTQEVAVPVKIKSENILTLTQNNFSVIPLQTVKPNQVNLVLDNTLYKSGFYEVKVGDSTLTHLACNVEKSESSRHIWDIDQLKQSHPDVTFANSIRNTLDNLAQSQQVMSYFKWFLLLALLFLIIEMLILKYL